MESVGATIEVRRMLLNFLEEDVGTGDTTSNSIIPSDLVIDAEIVCKTNNAIVCGLDELGLVFDLCGCSSRALVKDGMRLREGKRVMTISGNARSILKAERVALNILMRMSGIATETRTLSNAAHPIKVAATRKTAPGLRYFDKKAVVVGGGMAHRMRLDDMVLIKDNHIAIVGTSEECVKMAKEKVGTHIKVECEAKNLNEAIGAIKAGADIIMLDNFSPTRAAQTIRKITKLGLRTKVLIEISGGVNYKNIRQYALAKPDYISTGYITHSPKAIDFSLEII